MIWRIMLLVVGLTLAACTGAKDLNNPPVPLGNFSLGHNVVVAPKVETAATVSRSVTEEELTEAVKLAIAERFDRYDGAKEYHFGVSIEGYILAKPGVPLLLSPPSAMIVRITVWDDALGKKLNSEPEQLTVLETLDGDSIVGSGWTQTKEAQLKKLSRNAAQMIENYIAKKNAEEGWFGDEPGVAPVESENVASAVIEEKRIAQNE